MDVPEAPLERTEHGLVCKGDGWFVVNAREVRWRRWPGLGFSSNLSGDILFDQLGIGLTVLGPGEPMSMYHWETDQEDFLILAGEATLVIEGQERPLRQWDFVHCPPHTGHVIVGAGDGPCVVLAMSSRENQQYGPYGEYTVDETARRFGASVDADVHDTDVAYANVPGSKPTRYRDGWLPEY